MQDASKSYVAFFAIMHYSVRCGHRGLRPMPIVARLCYAMTLLSFPKLVWIPVLLRQGTTL